jgi:Bromodomain
MLHISMLMAFQTKLLNRQYATLAEVEGDVKRMILNAKQFNAKGSSIYDDAERVRKTTSNFMTKHNPAYLTDGYQAVATPIPGGDSQEPVTPLEPIPVATSDSKKSHSRRSSRIVGGRKSEPELEPEEAEDELVQDEEVEDGEEDAEGEDEVMEDEAPQGPERFRGKTFQEAQDLIIDELINHTEYVCTRRIRSI